jgi:methionine biosynthesis protein MetW
LNSIPFSIEWIEPNSRVLDLGCGNGSLLTNLIKQLQVRSFGLEIDPEAITQCIHSGLNVVEQDLNNGLTNFRNDSFDTVLMTQTLQALRYPHLMLDDMLRIGSQAIVTFPNFGHWRTRLSLLLNGRMPVTKQLSYEWYDTPNIHFFTYKDFEVLCADRGIKIADRIFIGGYASHIGLDRLWPNLFAQTAVYRLTK